VKTNKLGRPSSPSSVAGLLRRTGVAALRRVDATQAWEKSLATRPTGKYVLRLFVAGATARSRQAVLRVRQLCEAELKDNYELEVIDVYQQPILARDGQIIATPTLVKELPPPVRRLIGNLANITRLFVGLDLDTKGKTRL
jgi:circadian clock protein KaiB